MKIIFVGSFKQQAKDGSVGGQMFACGSLIESDISKDVEWILIDSTADSNKLAPLFDRLLKAARRLLKFIYCILFKKIDIALIFTADGYSFVEKGMMVIIAKAFRKKTILAPRSGIIVDDVKNSAFMRKYIPLVLSNCDFVICQSEIWRDFFSKIYNPKANIYKVIHNWVNTKNYELVSQNKEKNNSIRLLFLSWVDKNKGIFELIEAALRLKEKNIKIHFDIAGDGLAMDEARQAVSDNGMEDEFTFYSWVKSDKKLELLRVADIYVLPSHYEGYPNSLMEAMASGKACVATTVGSIPDIIVHEKNGLLFEAGNVSDLVAQIEKLMDGNFRKAIGNEAKRITIARNSIEIAVASFKEIFQQVYPQKI